MDEEDTTVRRDWARILGVIGALIVIASIAWEYARMKPDNLYIVSPWSFRGYESVHGTVFAMIGVALLLAVLLVAAKVTQEPAVSLAVVFLMVGSAWLIAYVSARDESFTLTGDSIVAFLLAAALGLVFFLPVKRIAEAAEADELVGFLSGATGLLIAIIAVVIWTYLLGLIIGDQRVVDAHWAILGIMFLLGLLMSLMRTVSMAANRMLMASTLVASATVALSGAAIRTTLVRFQAETDPFIPGEYRDTQVTWGFFLANIGLILVFAGALTLWARRRDVVQSQQRAAKQRAAAEDSARELAAAQ